MQSLIIDTDNALGFPATLTAKLCSGDVDDAFAITYLVCKRQPVAALWSTWGNASAAVCHRNNRDLLGVLGSDIPCYADYAFGTVPSISTPVDFLALGPLTNLDKAIQAQAIRLNTVWVTLGRIATNGRWPPVWPMEFNLTKDRHAFRNVADYCEQHRIPLIVSPLDVAGKLLLTPVLAERLKTTVAGNYLYRHLQRWQWRNALLKGRRSFPVWDLLCAMACANPGRATLAAGKGYYYDNGLLLCDVDDRPRTGHARSKARARFPIQVVAGLDLDWAWQEFFATLASFHTQQAVPDRLGGRVLTDPCGQY